MKRLSRLAILAAALTAACTVVVRNPQLREGSPEAALAARTAPRPAGAIHFVKAHMHDGSVAVVQDWSVEDQRFISGRGTRYDAERRALNAKPETLRVPIDSVALLETDSPTTAFSMINGVKNLWTVAWGATTIICALDPKSCFGSCPTFYVEGEDVDRPRAEGFSSSIARIREATDIDDLRLSRPGGAVVALRVKNEAWETHAIRWVRLHAVAQPADADVVATGDGAFVAVRAARAPTRCTAQGRDCRSAVAARDALEWVDVTDADDLTRPDTMQLEFEGSPARPGLVLSARQSFVSTFVLYQTMAWLGAQAGEWLARLERGDPVALRPLETVEALIGTVKVEQQDTDGTWREEERFTEAGPIANDRHLIALREPEPDGRLRLRLIYAKGNWRVDEAQLVAVGEAIAPVTLEPRAARLANREHPDALGALLDPDRYFLAFPGDDLALDFVLPGASPRYALFLESRGHYYEWMRGEWIAEQDAAMVATLMRDPVAGLRRMAPMYKAREAAFETAFWASRFGRVP